MTPASEARSGRTRMLADLSAVPRPAIETGSRQVEETDARALGLLAFAAYRGTVDDEGESPDEQVAEMAATLAGRYGPLMTPSSRLIESGTRAAVAAVVVTWWDGLPFLAFCMTHPDAQRRGIGRDLIGEAAHALAAQGHRQVHLAVTRANPALNLYRRLGFREAPVPARVRGTPASPLAPGPG